MQQTRGLRTISRERYAEQQRQAAEQQRRQNLAAMHAAARASK